MATSTKHKHFLLSDSPVKSTFWNAVISVALWTIVGLNLYNIIQSYNVLQASVIF